MGLRFLEAITWAEKRIELLTMTLTLETDSRWV